jgi:soluble cytochrome b562
MQLSTSSRVAALLIAGICLAPVAMSGDPGDDKKPAAQPAQAPSGQPGERRGPAPSAPVSVEASMKQMNRGLRQLRKQMGDAALREENLKIVNEMQRGCIAAKAGTVPADLLKSAKDDAEKAKLVEGYRKGLVASMRLLLDIEDAIADGKGDVASAKADELVKLRDATHKEMGIRED